MLKGHLFIKAENDFAQNFRVSDYASKLFEIKFKETFKTNKCYISPEEESFKNEIKNQFFEFLIEENPWTNDNFKRNTENAVKYYFSIIKSFKQT